MNNVIINLDKLPFFGRSHVKCGYNQPWALSISNVGSNFTNRFIVAKAIQIIVLYLKEMTNVEQEGCGLC